MPFRYTTVSYQGSIKSSVRLPVGHDATDEAWLCGHEHVDEVVELVSEVGANGLEVGHLGSGLRFDHNAPGTVE